MRLQTSVAPQIFTKLGGEFNLFDFPLHMLTHNVSLRWQKESILMEEVRNTGVWHEGSVLLLAYPGSI